MMLVYVAGPFRASTPLGVEKNIRAAEEVGLNIARGSGWSMFPVVPHSLGRFYDKTWPDDFALNGTMALMLQCQAVMMCPGWAESEGSVAEYNKAREVGIPVFESVDLLLRRCGRS